jgi:hypothetical protein
MIQDDPWRGGRHVGLSTASGRGCWVAAPLAATVFLTGVKGYARLRGLGLFAGPWRLAARDGARCTTARQQVKTRLDKRGEARLKASDCRPFAAGSFPDHDARASMLLWHEASKDRRAIAEQKQARKK